MTLPPASVVALPLPADMRRSGLLPFGAVLISIIELSLQRLATRGPQWLQAARWGAEILMRLGQVQALFQSIRDTAPHPWALLGMARYQLKEGASAAVLQTLRQLLELQHPDHPDELNGLKRALAATPLAIGRQQQIGILAQQTCKAHAVKSPWLVLQRHVRDLPGAERWQQQVGALRRAHGTGRRRPALGAPRLRPAGSSAPEPLNWLARPRSEPPTPA